MGKIKSFLYLDEYKIYSISSQLFEGLTEYVVHSEKRENESSETQKGPMASGRILAEILSSSEQELSKKVLHDYSYTLLENELSEQSKVLEIDLDNINDSIDNLESYHFIKVKGKAVFRDIAQITSTLRNYNAIGKSMAHVSNFQEISQAKSLIEDKLKVAKNQEKGALKSELKKISDVNELAIKSGLSLDQEFCNDLAYLLEYGYKDNFEVQITVGNNLFSAPLVRSNLKEGEHSFISKYSRSTEKEFVVFGVICQSSGEDESNIDCEDEDDSSGNLKTALQTFVSALSEVEKSFTGKLENEIIIDPIAVYREL